MLAEQVSKAFSCFLFDKCFDDSLEIDLYKLEITIDYRSSERVEPTETFGKVNETTSKKFYALDCNLSYACRCGKSDLSR